MSTMKLDLLEWKNLAISHMTLMAQQLNQASALRQEDLARIDIYWTETIRPRLEAWAAESVIAMQEQQRAQVSQPARIPPVPEDVAEIIQDAAKAPPQNGASRRGKGGWPKGKPRTRKPKASPEATVTQ